MPSRRRSSSSSSSPRARAAPSRRSIPSGLRISCASPAASRPSAARRSARSACLAQLLDLGRDPGTRPARRASDPPRRRARSSCSRPGTSCDRARVAMASRADRARRGRRRSRGDRQHLRERTARRARAFVARRISAPAGFTVRTRRSRSVVTMPDVMRAKDVLLLLRELLAALSAAWRSSPPVRRRRLREAASRARRRARVRRGCAGATRLTFDAAERVALERLVGRVADPLVRRREPDRDVRASRRTTAAARAARRADDDRGHQDLDRRRGT